MGTYIVIYEFDGHLSAACFAAEDYKSAIEEFKRYWDDSTVPEVVAVGMHLRALRGVVYHEPVKARIEVRDHNYVSHLGKP